MYFNIVSFPSVVTVGLPVVVPEYADVANLNTTNPEPPATPCVPAAPPHPPPPRLVVPATGDT